MPACCAERGADGYFPLPRSAAGEEKIGDVHTGDQQDEADGAHQQPEVLDGVFADEVILQGLDGRAPSLVGFWVDFGDVACDGVHVRVGLLDCDSWFQAAHHQNKMKIVVDLFRLEGQRNKQLIFQAIGLPYRQDSHNSVGLAIESDGLADDVAIAPEALHPEPMRHDDHAVLADLPFLR